MRVVVQRSKKSNVVVDGKLINEIDNGMVLLVSFTQGDTEDNILKMVKKIANLRIFDDENGVMNKLVPTKPGIFGAEMILNITNDGPRTILLEF